MCNKKEMIVRWKERIRIYEDSPGMQATYIDLAHILEDLIDIVKTDSAIGFKPSENK